MKDKPLYEDYNEDALIKALQKSSLKYTVLCKSGDVRDLYFDKYDPVILYAIAHLDAQKVYCEGRLIYEEYNPLPNPKDSWVFASDETLLKILDKIDAL